jgi:hypothetical protein
MDFSLPQLYGEELFGCVSKFRSDISDRYRLYLYLNQRDEESFSTGLQRS